MSILDDLQKVGPQADANKKALADVGYTSIQSAQDLQSVAVKPPKQSILSSIDQEYGVSAQLVPDTNINTNKIATSNDILKSQVTGIYDYFAEKVSEYKRNKSLDLYGKTVPNVDSIITPQPFISTGIKKKELTEEDKSYLAFYKKKLALNEWQAQVIWEYMNNTWDSTLNAIKIKSILKSSGIDTALNAGSTWAWAIHDVIELGKQSLVDTSKLVSIPGNALLWRPQEKHAVLEWIRWVLWLAWFMPVLLPFTVWLSLAAQDKDSKFIKTLDTVVYNIGNMIEAFPGLSEKLDKDYEWDPEWRKWATSIIGMAWMALIGHGLTVKDPKITSLVPIVEHVIWRATELTKKEKMLYRQNALFMHPDMVWGSEPFFKRLNEFVSLREEWKISPKSFEESVLSLRKEFSEQRASSYEPIKTSPEAEQILSDQIETLADLKEKQITSITPDNNEPSATDILKDPKSNVNAGMSDLRIYWGTWDVDHISNLIEDWVARGLPVEKITEKVISYIRRKEWLNKMSTIGTEWINKYARMRASWEVTIPLSEQITSTIPATTALINTVQNTPAPVTETSSGESILNQVPDQEWSTLSDYEKEKILSKQADMFFQTAPLSDIRDAIDNYKSLSQIERMKKSGKINDEEYDKLFDEYDKNPLSIYEDNLSRIMASVLESIALAEGNSLGGTKIDLQETMAKILRFLPDNFDAVTFIKWRSVLSELQKLWVNNKEIVYYALNKYTNDADALEIIKWNLKKLSQNGTNRSVVIGVIPQQETTVEADKIRLKNDFESRNDTEKTQPFVSQPIRIKKIKNIFQEITTPAMNFVKDIFTKYWKQLSILSSEIDYYNSYVRNTNAKIEKSSVLSEDYIEIAQELRGMMNRATFTNADLSGINDRIRDMLPFSKKVTTSNIVEMTNKFYDLSRTHFDYVISHKTRSVKGPLTQWMTDREKFIMLFGQSSDAVFIHELSHRLELFLSDKEISKIRDLYKSELDKKTDEISRTLWIPHNIVKKYLQDWGQQLSNKIQILEYQLEQNDTLKNDDLNTFIAYQNLFNTASKNDWYRFHNESEFFAEELTDSIFRQVEPKSLIAKIIHFFMELFNARKRFFKKTGESFKEGTQRSQMWFEDTVVDKKGTKKSILDQVQEELTPAVEATQEIALPDTTPFQEWSSTPVVPDATDIIKYNPTVPTIEKIQWYGFDKKNAAITGVMILASTAASTIPIVWQAIAATVGLSIGKEWFSQFLLGVAGITMPEVYAHIFFKQKILNGYRNQDGITVSQMLNNEDSKHLSRIQEVIDQYGITKYIENFSSEGAEIDAIYDNLFDNIDTILKEEWRNLQDDTVLTDKEKQAIKHIFPAAMDSYKYDQLLLDNDVLRLLKKLIAIENLYRYYPSAVSTLVKSVAPSMLSFFENQSDMLTDIDTMNNELGQNMVDADLLNEDLLNTLTEWNQIPADLQQELKQAEQDWLDTSWILERIKPYISQSKYSRYVILNGTYKYDMNHGKDVAQGYENLEEYLASLELQLSLSDKELDTEDLEIAIRKTKASILKEKSWPVNDPYRVHSPIIQALDYIIEYSNAIMRKQKADILKATSEIAPVVVGTRKVSIPLLSQAGDILFTTLIDDVFFPNKITLPSAIESRRAQKIYGYDLKERTNINNYWYEMFFGTGVDVLNGSFKWAYWLVWWLKQIAQGWYSAGVMNSWGLLRAWVRRVTVGWFVNTTNSKQTIRKFLIENKITARTTQGSLIVSKAINEIRNRNEFSRFGINGIYRTLWNAGSVIDASSQFFFGWPLEITISETVVLNELYSYMAQRKNTPYMLENGKIDIIQVLEDFSKLPRSEKEIQLAYLRTIAQWLYDGITRTASGIKILQLPFSKLFQKFISSSGMQSIDRISNVRALIREAISSQSMSEMKEKLLSQKNKPLRDSGLKLLGIIITTAAIQQIMLAFMKRECWDDEICKTEKEGEMYFTFRRMFGGSMQEAIMSAIHWVVSTPYDLYDKLAFGMDDAIQGIITRNESQVRVGLDTVFNSLGFINDAVSFADALSGGKMSLTSWGNAKDLTNSTLHDWINNRVLRNYVTPQEKVYLIQEMSKNPNVDFDGFFWILNMSDYAAKQEYNNSLNWFARIATEISPGMKKFFGINDYGITSALLTSPFSQETLSNVLDKNDNSTNTLESITSKIKNLEDVRIIEGVFTGPGNYDIPYNFYSRARWKIIEIIQEWTGINVNIKPGTFLGECWSLPNDIFRDVPGYVPVTNTWESKLNLAKKPDGTINKTPTVGGAFMYNPGWSWEWYGHIGIVEDVFKDWSFQAFDTNSDAAWHADRRVISPGDSEYVRIMKDGWFYSPPIPDVQSKMRMTPTVLDMVEQAVQGLWGDKQPLDVKFWPQMAKRFESMRKDNIDITRLLNTTDVGTSIIFTAEDMADGKTFYQKIKQEPILLATLINWIQKLADLGPDATDKDIKSIFSGDVKQSDSLLDALAYYNISPVYSNVYADSLTKSIGNSISWKDNAETKAKLATIESYLQVSSSSQITSDAGINGIQIAFGDRYEKELTELSKLWLWSAHDYPFMGEALVALVWARSTSKYPVQYNMQAEIDMMKVAPDTKSVVEAKKNTPKELQEFDYIGEMLPHSWVMMSSKDAAWSNGVVLINDKEAPVYAPVSGLVVESSYIQWLGNQIKMQDVFGNVLHYSNLGWYNVEPGDFVKAGTQVGKMAENAAQVTMYTPDNIIVTPEKTASYLNQSKFTPKKKDVPTLPKPPTTQRYNVGIVPDEGTEARHSSAKQNWTLANTPIDEIVKIIVWESAKKIDFAALQPKLKKWKKKITTQKIKPFYSIMDEVLHTTSSKKNKTSILSQMIQKF